MSDAARIDDQLRRAFEGDAWHGPAVLELLSDVSATEASKRPIPGAHSIRELALHVRAWEEVVRRRLEGERIDELEPEKDFPAGEWEIDDAAESWARLLRSLQEEHQRLRDRVRRLGDGRLAEKVAGREHTVRDMLDGLVQHDLYHAGQIALLKKALRA